jgi:hypothetical protein
MLVFKKIDYFNTIDNINKYNFINSEQEPKLQKITLYFPIKNLELESSILSEDSDTTLKVAAICFFWFLIGQKSKIILKKIKGQDISSAQSFFTLLNSEKKIFEFLNMLYLENLFKSSVHKNNYLGVGKQFKDTTINSILFAQKLAQVNYMYPFLFKELQIKNFFFKTTYSFKAGFFLRNPYSIKSSQFPFWNK